MNHKNDIINIILFSLRKLYYIEGYYLYSKKMNKGSMSFIYELRRRQGLLNDFIKDYINF